MEHPDLQHTGHDCRHLYQHADIPGRHSSRNRHLPSSAGELKQRCQRNPVISLTMADIDIFIFMF